MMIQNGETAESLLEEIGDCRADSVGVEGFAECLRAGPNACPYALPFGYAFLCRHPRMGEIIENTLTTRKAPAGKG
jgi:hypothetical protein